MICYLRASTIQYDVRLQKYVQACENTKTPFMAFTWDRLNNCTSAHEHEIQYKRYSPYGRRWKNLWNLIMWQFYLLSQLIKYRKHYRVIHACNIETILPALLMKLAGKKVAFDVYDSVVIPIERFVSKHCVDLLILPNVRRLQQINLSEKDVKHFIEIENVPSFKNTTLVLKKEHDLGKQIRLAYVGVFERNIRGLENLISAVLGNENLSLEIAGVGSGMETMMRNAENKTQRIKYFGAVNYEEALRIMGRADFIIALYYLKNPLHKFASPNKYYESLFLGVPIITSQNTLVGNMVEEEGVGYAIGEKEEDLKILFDNITSSAKSSMRSYERKAESAKNIWSKTFSSYFERVLCGKYIETMLS